MPRTSAKAVKMRTSSPSIWHPNKFQTTINTCVYRSPMWFGLLISL
ncbi:hypothetical protein [Varibaculum sp.]|nr:hypothetical protein [Varibaculum sp.]